MIKILIADDHAIVRDILCTMLERASDMQVVAMASNGAEAITQANLYLPDIVVMDISMPIMGGFAATRHIHMEFPDTRVMILSAYDDPEYVKQALEAGASGFVLKDTAGDDLVAAIRLVYMGKRYFSQKVAEIAKRIMKQQRDDGGSGSKDGNLI